MPMPAVFELPRLVEKPHDKRLDNLRHTGRPKGATDKICRDLKQGVLTAAINVGRDGQGTDGLIGFLEDLAAHHKKLFTSLLVKVLPYNLTADVNKTSINEVRIVSIPSDHYVTGASDASGSPVVEHIPPFEPITPINRECEPQTERERRLLAELESLSHEELEERARQAGFFDADTD